VASYRLRLGEAKIWMICGFHRRGLEALKGDRKTENG